MKTLLFVICLTLYGVAFCESDKYLVLTDTNKEVYCENVEVTETGYRAIINGETKEYKFSEAMLKMKGSSSQSDYNPAPKQVATDKPKEKPLPPNTTIYKGKVVPLNKIFVDADGQRKFIST